jgi:hypothetical protein
VTFFSGASITCDIQYVNNCTQRLQRLSKQENEQGAESERSEATCNSSTVWIVKNLRNSKNNIVALPYYPIF